MVLCNRKILIINIKTVMTGLDPQFASGKDVMSIDFIFNLILKSIIAWTNEIQTDQSISITFS